jgi:hypothetical protein
MSLSESVVCRDEEMLTLRGKEGTGEGGEYLPPRTVLDMGDNWRRTSSAGLARVDEVDFVRRLSQLPSSPPINSLLLTDLRSPRVRELALGDTAGPALDSSLVSDGFSAGGVPNVISCNASLLLSIRVAEAEIRASSSVKCLPRVGDSTGDSQLTESSLGHHWSGRSSSRPEICPMIGGRVDDGFEGNAKAELKAKAEAEVGL